MTDDPDHPYAAFALALQQAWRQKPNVAASAVAALDMIEAALSDTRFTSVEMLREAVRPALSLCPRPAPDATQRRHIQSWLDTVAASWSLQQAVEEIEGAPGVPSPAGVAPSPVTPADSAAAAALLKEAIEAGDNVVELPSGVRVRREKGKP